MNAYRFCMLSIFLIGAIGCANAQSHTHETRQDSISSQLYNNIYEYSKQKKLSRKLYRLFFRKPVSTDIAPTTAKPVYHSIYKNAEGKIIRNIVVTTKSPFETTDSAAFFSEAHLGKMANVFHVNTQKFVIRNLLMFKENEVFDSLAVQESERLIRSRRYINRARILVAPAAGDSVDVMVQTRDEFTLAPEGRLSSSSFGIGLKERNFFGLGHQAHVAYEWDFEGDVNNYQYGYNLSNIRNSYISADFIYRWNPVDGREIKRFSLNRPFYSPLARWAGGVDLMQQAKRAEVYSLLLDSTVVQSFRYNIYDFWGAYAVKFKSRSAKARSRNIILSSRYYHIDYPTKPLAEYDPYNVYSREDLYLFGIGFSERTYQQDNYLFKFGWTEDVPVGKAYSLTVGLQRKNGKNRPYLAAKATQGRYFKAGYWGYALQYGSFFNGKNIEEGIATAEITYFTHLVEFGGWKFRQLMKPQAMFGINRLPTERLSLNGFFGSASFGSAGVGGTSKISCIFQSQFFTPWNWWGFRFGPYVTYAVIALGNRNGFSHDRLRSMLGIGVLFRNDHLVFNSFELSISFFMSSDQYQDYRFNSYSLRDFSFRDFDIGKPERIEYE